MEIVLETATLTLLALVSAVNVVTATENGVLLKSSELQKITSNTLKWVSPSPPGSIPENAVIGSLEYVLPNAASAEDNSGSDFPHLNVTDRSQLRENRIYICRAFLDGIWVPGAVFEHSRACIVSTVVKVHQVQHYDVLSNIDQAARLVWKDWERQVEVPLGAVSAGEYYIAHSASPKLNILSEKLAVGMLFRIGKIDPQEGIFGKLSVVDEDNVLVNDVDSGQVLVEIEPSFYELTITNLTYSRSKILSQETKILGETTLRNDDDTEMKAEAVIPYEWKYESSWGQGKAMSKALETRIQFRNSTPIETISWGLPVDTKKDGTESVEIMLDSGTASHVTLTATLVELEVPYTGTLLSVFADSNTMNRTIHGIWRHTALTKITPNYGPLYFIRNNTLVPTTAAPTTTPTTTTEASSTFAATISTVESKASGKSAAKDDALTDDSDALQLKKKDDAEKNGSPKISCFLKYPILGSIFIVSYFVRYTRCAL